MCKNWVEFYHLSCWMTCLPLGKCVALVLDGISGSGGKREKYFCEELKAFPVYT